MKKIQDKEQSERKIAGALLSVIPSHAEWDCFLSNVKSEWENWNKEIERFPNNLVVLYSGLAFFEYESHTFWPHFTKVIGIKHLPANQQNEINRVFSKSARTLGLKIQKGENRTNYIGLAVYYVGILLSLWDGFLEICEWAKKRGQIYFESPFSFLFKLPHYGKGRTY